MENEMETGDIKGLYRDPGIQMIPALRPKVCKCYLQRAIWIPRGDGGSYRRDSTLGKASSSALRNNMAEVMGECKGLVIW